MRSRKTLTPKFGAQIIGKNHLRNYLWPLLVLLSKCVAHLVDLGQVQAPSDLLMLDCESFNILTQPSFKLLMLGGWDQPAQLVLPSLLLALPGSPCMQQCTIACVTFLHMVFAFLSFYTSYTFLKPITRWFTPCWAPSYFPSVHSSSSTCESFPGYCRLILTWLLFFLVIVVEYRLGWFFFQVIVVWYWLGCYFSRVLSFNIDLVVFPFFVLNQPVFPGFHQLSGQGPPHEEGFALFFVKKKIRKCYFTSRRATDFHLAKICGGIVAVFVVCNLPRLAIGGFEIWRWIVASIQIQFDIPLQDPHYPSLHRVIGPVLGSWDSGGKNVFKCFELLNILIFHFSWPLK